MKATKEGLSKQLVTLADVEKQLLAQGVPAIERTGDKVMVPPLTAGAIRSCKIMYDQSRLRSGIPQSKGYGFVEFQHHAHALACLRELDNNVIYHADAAGGKTQVIDSYIH